jgi:predicted permease
MTRIRGLRRLFRFPRRSDQQIDRDVDDELAFHIDMVAKELIDSGVPEPHAWARARRQFGDIERTRRTFRGEEKGIERERRRAQLGSELRQDLVFAARQFRRSPAFAAVAVITFGLGIGATTAIFSVVDGVLLRPLPYREPERLVRLRQLDSRKATPDDASPANFIDWRDRNRSFERVAFFQYFGHDVRGTSGETISIDSWLVSEDYFDVLGVKPYIGRVFLPDDFRPGAAPVAIISTSLWRQRYGGDPTVLGRREILDGVPHAIIGVMPAAFQYPEKRHIWAPKMLTDEEKRVRAGPYLAVIGRLRGGVSMAAAQDDMERVARDLAAAYPQTNARLEVRLTSVPDDVLGAVRPALLVLVGAVACVLLVACANVANLLLARGADRQREFAIRAALGAGRGRLTRQMVSESAMLAALGCALGLIVGRVGLSVLIALSPATLPRTDEISLDGRVLAFTIATSVFTAVLFGLGSARVLWRADLHRTVRDGGRGTSASPRKLRLRSALIVAEVALALVLLVGSGLLIRSFIVLLRVDPGFVSANRAMVQVFLWDQYPKPELRAAALHDVLERMAAVPGVRSVGAVSALPFAEANIGVQTPIRFEGRPAPPPGESPNVYTTVATNGYFETMGVALRRGRTFTASDNAAGTRIALVGESLVRHHFPNEDPIGRHVKVMFDGGQSREIVGIVADVRHDGLQATPREEVYLPHAQVPFGSMTIVARTTTDPAALLPALQRAVWDVNRNQAIYAATTMDALVSSSLRERRFNLALIGSFAALALVLSAVGVYGLISYSTSRRANEFGVRLALGASARQIVVAAMRDGVRFAAIGVVIGLAASYALTRWMATMLFGVTATDPLTFALLGLVMVAVATVASFVPARRALRVDPVTALRTDS